MTDGNLTIQNGIAYANHAAERRVQIEALAARTQLAALRATRNAKALNLTEGVDPTAPERFREHGGALCFKGKGPERHAQDPARRESSAGGAD